MSGFHESQSDHRLRRKGRRGWDSALSYGTQRPFANSVAGNVGSPVSTNAKSTPLERRDTAFQTNHPTEPTVSHDVALSRHGYIAFTKA